MRVRAFTQDDGHIFCTEAQIQEEVKTFTTLLQKVYKDFGFTNIIYKLSTRPEKRIGTEESWDRAEMLWRRVCARPAATLSICRVRALFTAPKLSTH